jgi:outer membrane protein assembly factor BamB
MPTPLTHDDPVALGEFRLVARLGSGGMGTVYVARSARGATVALKTMHASIAADPAARTRFRLETDAARVIGDRFGAKVVDADPLGPVPWLATEYVLGPPLDEAVERVGVLPEAAVRALGAGLCSALGQLHRSDVVHRDLKPSNILVTAYGPKVIDFGIARAIGDDHLTRTGSAVGTPAFMSPEQATGLEHGPAGDVFALAGVLVHAATGSGAFGRGRPADLLYRVRYAEPDLTGVPASLVPVLTRCLEKDPARRPTTDQLAAELHDGQGEFAEHLSDELLGEIGRRAADVWQIVPQRTPAPLAETVPGPGPAPKPAKSASRRALLAGGGVVALGAAGGGAWWWSRKRHDAEDGPKGPAQTLNLDPVWATSGKFMDYWGNGPVVPLGVGGEIRLASGAVTFPYNPENGLRKKDFVVDGMSWQVVLSQGVEYRVLTSFGHAAKSVLPAGISLWDLKQDYIRGTKAYFRGTNSDLEGNQLLGVFGTVAYAAVGEGQEPKVQGFLRSQTFTLRAIDVKSGDQLWSQPLPKRPDESKRLHFVSATVVGDQLITLQEPRPGTVELVVRSAKTGAVLWKRPYGTTDAAAREALRSPIAVDDRYVYLGGDGLRALRRTDGKQAWAARTGTAYSPPAVRSGVLYAVSEADGLSAFTAASGKSAWTEQAPDPGLPSRGWAPVLGTRWAYYRNGVHLHAVDLGTHKLARTYKTKSTSFSVDRQDKLLLGIGEEELSAYPLK